MKLLRHGPKGHEKPAMLDAQGQVRDLSALIPDLRAEMLTPEGLAVLRAIDPSQLPLVAQPGRMAPPWSGMGKFICSGLNYADHAKESGADIPKEPILFFKSTSSLVGPNDEIIIPRGSQKTDWEVELAVIIGKRASYVSESDAMRHVAGYALHNDYSEREWQLERGGQWVKGKSCDTFAPLGPFLATRDEIAEPHALSMWLKVNGVTRQSSSTAQMIFGVPQLVSYISQFMTLLPGDVISTGTPPGVGLGLKPTPVFLKPGDVVELGIEGLGESKQHAVACR